ncbi:MAG: PSD1 and planctomycete cytochrome C domain-containing protein [Isosphaeraceae bacterium]
MIDLPRFSLLALAILGAVASTATADDRARVSYEREIRPILSANCFACHGLDEKNRGAALRLDIRDGAIAELKSGTKAIVPGEPDESELLERLATDDASLKMPPPKTGKSLKPEQVETLRRWIAEGAEYSQHWAFSPPRRAEPPALKQEGWAKGVLDRFILARLEAEGLAPSPEADRTTLIRRVTLDLTGLPPTPKEIDEFLADSRADAYDRLVQRLLESPRFGEHMARFWLDAARYGDTHGLHLDNYREIWPYREWVIRAFNNNLPFDRFITEQLAGDLLPNPTPEQIIATGFNRCHVSTSEGGSIEEEVYVRNVVDQVETNGTVFLGLSIGCARCHDHKYDPVKMKDFYSLFAFFNNIDGPALDGNASKWAPFVQVPTPEQSAALAAADSKVAEWKGKLEAILKESRDAYNPAVDADQSEVVRRVDHVWVDDALPPGAKPGEIPFAFARSADQPVRGGAQSIKLQAKGLQQVYFIGAGKKLKVGEADSLFAYVYLDPLDPPKEIMLQWHTGAWTHRAYWGENLIDWGKDNTGERLRIGDLPPSGEWVRLEVDTRKLGIKPGTVIDGWAFTQHDGTAYWDQAGIRSWTPQDGQTYDTFTDWLRARKADKAAGLAKPLQEAVLAERSKRTDAQKAQLLDAFFSNGYAGNREKLDPVRAELAKAEQERKAIDDAIPTTLVFREKKGEPRTAYLLNRGEYDQRKDKVGRALPDFLPKIPEGAPLDRLGLARWLVMPEHPLTARVAVNRFWQQVFGTGIVKTAEDFGLQGEPPSHPELLDRLAVDFREGGWDVKELVRTLVTSATYRQAARVTPDRLAKDPSNRLLSRGPRFRLDAESLRDQALFLSGLLVEKVGGPSVKPPQPSGLWEAVGYTSSNTARFVADQGPEKVNRRSLYIFWKRTSPPPQMTITDAPSRESCVVRRERTNTPLQALLLMNEPQYVEASRALAERAMKEGGSTAESRIEFLFRLATARRPESKELAELASAYRELLDHYRAAPESAKELVAIGESKPDPALDPSELAAWSMIANAVLNLDEVVTKG